jgi:peptidoglycan hydrolase-like protein with peptidoglycan-binding domain
MTMLARRAPAAIAGSDTLMHIDRTLRRGGRGEQVTLVQEWLCLHEFGVMIDGRFGYATEQAVKDFQGASGVLPVTGEVDPQTFALLTRPMAEALRRIEPPQGAAFGQMVAACALQHLRNHAREVGGQNRGPWVRLYLHGDQRPRDPHLPQGVDAWCAGFVSTMIAQAASSLEVELPIDYHTNCTRLGEEAIREGRLITGERAMRDLAKIPTGSLMLLRHTGRRDRWHHTGVVTQALPKFVRTIEGNSAYSTDENPSGHAVVRQMRSYGNLDFIVL